MSVFFSLILYLSLSLAQNLCIFRFPREIYQLFAYCSSVTLGICLSRCVCVCVCVCAIVCMLMNVYAPEYTYGTDIYVDMYLRFCLWIRLVCWSSRTCGMYVHTYTANPTSGDISESSFKAQSSKLEGLFSLKRGKRDVRALSFELWKSFRKYHPTWDWLYTHILTHTYVHMYIHTHIYM